MSIIKEPKIIKLSTAPAIKRSKYRFKRTGNLAMDAIGALVSNYRGKLNVIYLSPYYMGLFRQHVQAQMKRKNVYLDKSTQKFSYSGIPVELKTLSWGKVMAWNIYGSDKIIEG
jgi:hypothetical protein